MDLYINSPMHLHGAVLNLLRTGTTLRYHTEFLFLHQGTSRENCITTPQQYTLRQKSLKNITLRRTDPFLCNDRKMCGYNRAVSGQRLSKHVPVASQQILKNTTVGL
jgi:hypothetical protein